MAEPRRDQKVRHDIVELRDIARLTVSTITAMASLVAYFTSTMDTTMKTAKDLLDKINELGQDEAAYQAREQAIVNALQTQVNDLTAKVNAGQETDTQQFIDGLQSIIDAIPTAPTVDGTPSATPTPDSGPTTNTPTPSTTGSPTTGSSTNG